MDFGLTQKQVDIQKKFRELCAKEIAPRAAAVDEAGKFPEENWSALAAAGYFKIALPGAHGGDGDALDCAVTAAEELAAACASTAICAGAGSFVPGLLISKYGTEAAKAKWLPGLADGKLVGAYAVIEPQGGHLSDIASEAVKGGGGYEISGSKGIVTNAARADLFIVFAKLDGNLTAFVAEKGAAIKIGGKVRTMGMRGAAVADVTFDKCAVDASGLLGAEGAGEAVAAYLFDIAKLHLSAVSTGIARSAYEAGKKHAETRVSGGKPIGVYQEVSFRVADMYIESDTARQLTYCAAWNLDEGSADAGQLVTVAKLYASETAVRNANRAVQIYGGAGYTVEAQVERLYRDAKYTEIGDGTNEVQRMMLADELMKD